MGGSNNAFTADDTTAYFETVPANHLQRIKYILPEAKVKALQKLPIWLDHHYEPLGSMQYHPGVTWLRVNKHDPRLVKHVHIPRAKALLNRGQWAKHPYVILHELAHAYHDQVLENGFQNKAVLDAYKKAKAKGEAKKDKKKDKEKDDDSDDARAAFFRRALETAHGLGVVDCMDCKIETE